jgi:hypothetical protein
MTQLARWRGITGFALLISVLAVAGCSGGHRLAGPAATPTATTTKHSAVPSPSPAPSATPTPGPAGPAPLPVAPGAAARHQTMARPRASGRAFQAMITDLWLAVRTGKASLGRQAFFPVGAYKQVKAIADPASDWRTRLWDDFVLDVQAAHRLLGHGARSAKLLRVLVLPAADDSWIGPGACYNSVGYWHVANSRVVYRLGGQIRSFGIASLISWRGVWYVVHFGGVVRPAVGMVDEPTTGPGVAGPQGGC